MHGNLGESPAGAADARPGGRHTYTAHGLHIVSARPLRALRPLSDAPPCADVTLAWRRAAQFTTPKPDEFVIRDLGHLSVAFVGSLVVLWSYCGSRAEFERPRPGEALRINVYRPPGISTERFEHTLLHAFLPNALVAGGASVLHAASVVIGDRAFLFAGDSGMGKSTLAAGFARRGFTVLAEDIARLDWLDGQVVTFASYPGARLRSNSFLLPQVGVRARPGRFGLPKHRVLNHATPDGTAPYPVGGLLFLRRARQVAPTLSRLRPTEALPELLRSAFLQTLPAASRSREAIARATRVLASTPVWSLAYRRSPAHFGMLLDALTERLGGAVNGNGALA